MTKATFFPKSDLILVNLDENTGKTETGIIVPGSTNFASGVVMGSGPKSDCRIKQRIIFERMNLIEVEHKGEKFHLVRDSNVLGVIVESKEA